MKNMAKEILDRIDTMLADRTAEVEAIKAKLAENETELNKLREEQHSAMERTDAAAYRKAKDAIADAEAAVEMYGKRLDQIWTKEFLTEEDSDAVINGLLAFEDDLAAEYEKAIKAPIERLQKLHDDYIETVNQTEEAFRRWTSEIHSYHHVRGTTYSDGTDRSDTPVPVHRTPYKGCAVSARVGKFLDMVYPREDAVIF